MDTCFDLEAKLLSLGKLQYKNIMQCNPKCSKYKLFDLQNTSKHLVHNLEYGIQILH